MPVHEFGVSEGTGFAFTAVLHFNLTAEALEQTDGLLGAALHRLKVRRGRFGFGGLGHHRAGTARQADLHAGLVVQGLQATQDLGVVGGGHEPRRVGVKQRFRRRDSLRYLRPFC